MCCRQPVVLHVVDKALPALLATAPWEVLGNLTPPPVAMGCHQLEDEQHQQHSTAQHGSGHIAQRTTIARLLEAQNWCVRTDRP